MMRPGRHPSLRGRLLVLTVFLVGVVLTLVGFFYAREAHRRQVEAQFQAAAQDRAESVIRGVQNGFDDINILRGFFEASDNVTRKDFSDFLAPLLNRHPYIQAYQWLPWVTQDNRAFLEAEARRAHPGFRYFQLDATRQPIPMEAGASFYAVHYVEPYRGNEVILGLATALPVDSQVPLTTRQQALAAALQTGRPTASGRIRLIQEPGQQFGVLVIVPLSEKNGRRQGVVQGVFRMGDLVQKSMAFLEPKGVAVRLLDEGAPDAERLLHEEPSPLPSIGVAKNEGLLLTRRFPMAGRNWVVQVIPAGGHYLVGVPWLAWAVLWIGLAFSVLVAGYVRALQVRESDVRGLVEQRTHELALETESHRRDALALRDSEARFRHLIEVMGEGLWVLDAEGSTTFVNRRMAEMLGHTQADMVGRPLFDFMAEADAEQARRNMAERQAGRGARHDFRFQRKDGSELWTIVTGTPVLNASGQVVSILGVVMDITERRRQEQAQLQSQKLESLGVLAGGIAHDFNNLLTAILGNVNLAQLCLSKVSPAWPYLDNMERTVHRATNLTRQMLAYSGKGRFMVGPVDLNQAVEEMSHLLGVSISKKVALRYQLQPGLPVLMGEATQIQQVIMNLVTNASEAIGDGEGIVSIRTGTQTYAADALARDFPGQGVEPGPFLTLEVADTGQGMTPDVQARIFEPFFTTKFTGRGLGLSAMQGIVRGHHGGIRVYSESGKGSTFKLIFPAGVGESQEMAEAHDEDGWRGSGLVLVVDDEAGVRQVASALLSSMGFTVVTADDGLEALERYRASAEPIRVVLMDLTMPRMDGTETFRELRRMDPTCRVVLTSGYNQQDAIQDFLGKGLAGFVQKPFLREDLQRAMREALEG